MDLTVARPSALPSAAQQAQPDRRAAALLRVFAILADAAEREAAALAQQADAAQDGQPTP